VIYYVQFSGSLFDTVANNNRDVERKNGGFDDEVGLYFPPVLSTTVLELFSSVSVWAWSGVKLQSFEKGRTTRKNDCLSRIYEAE
jgi:hypothetical protein